MVSITVELVKLVGLVVLFSRDIFSNPTQSLMIVKRQTERKTYRTTAIFHGVSSIQCSLRCLRNKGKCHHVITHPDSLLNSDPCELLIEDDTLQQTNPNQNTAKGGTVLGFVDAAFDEVKPCDKYKDARAILSMDNPGRLTSQLPITIACNATRNNAIVSITTLRIDQNVILPSYTPVSSDNGKLLSCITTYRGCTESKTLQLEVTDWALIQRRVDDSVDFNRDWVHYKNGFGNENGNFWRGLEETYQMMKNRDITMRVDLWDGSTAYRGEYQGVTLSDEADSYRFNYDLFSGNSSDGLKYHHKNSRFSTKDRDNDDSFLLDCAGMFKGGWWFGKCLHSNLNGLYGENSNKGIHWLQVTGGSRSLSKTEMKIRII